MLYNWNLLALVTLFFFSIIFCCYRHRSIVWCNFRMQSFVLSVGVMKIQRRVPLRLLLGYEEVVDKTLAISAVDLFHRWITWHKIFKFRHNMFEHCYINQYSKVLCVFHSSLLCSSHMYKLSLFPIHLPPRSHNIVRNHDWWSTYFLSVWYIFIMWDLIFSWEEH